MYRSLFVALLAAALAHAADVPPKQRAVVVISIDGFPAYELTNDRLPIPTLRRLIKEGAAAKRMTIVNPAVTWPNHTTMVTGVPPLKHGVLFNGLLMRDVFPPKVEPWKDKAELVRVPTVYDLAFQAGLTTAQVDWVAIYGAKTITWQFAERPDPNGAIEKEMVTRGSATRQQIADFMNSNPAWRDQMWTDAAAHIIRQHKPNLMLFHLLDLDSIHHNYGPRSTASYAAIGYADSKVQQILDALAAAGLKDKSTVLIVSDHGFKPVKRHIRPNALLAEEHLSGTVHAIAEGGTAMVYVSKSSPDPRMADRVSKLFAGVEGVARVILPPDYHSLGLPMPEEINQAPEVLLAAKDGYAFANGNSGPVVVDAPPGNGQHGYLSSDPEMDAIFIAWGYGIRPGVQLDAVRNIDVAPTIAKLLGLQMTGIDGQALSGALK